MQQNIFNKVHEPLRLALLNTCMFLSRNQQGEAIAPMDVMKKVTAVIKVFKAVVKHEGLYILPLIFEYEPSVWDAYTREHHKAMNIADRLEGLIQSLGKSKDKEEQQQLVGLVGEAFNEFTLFNYHHMDDEEEVLSEIFLRYYKDDVLIPFGEQFEVLTILTQPTAHKDIYETAHAA